MGKTSNEEIAANASRLAKWVMQDLPKDVGFVLMVFPKDAEGQQSACLSNCGKDRVARELKGAHGRLGDRLIIESGGN